MRKCFQRMWVAKQKKNPNPPSGILHELEVYHEQRFSSEFSIFPFWLPPLLRRWKKIIFFRKLMKIFKFTGDSRKLKPLANFQFCDENHIKSLTQLIQFMSKLYLKYFPLKASRFSNEWGGKLLKHESNEFVDHLDFILRQASSL